MPALRRSSSIVLFAAVLFALPLHATQIHWIGTGGNWSNAANWNPAQVPASTDDVFIDAAGTYAVTVDASPTVANLTIGGGTSTAPTLFIGPPNSLTVSGTATVAANGVLSLAGGTVSPASMTVNGSLSWSAGTLSGATNIASGGSLTINTASAPTTLDAGTLTVAGSATFQGSNTLYLNHGGQLNVQSGTTFEIRGDGPINVSLGPLGTISNAGTIRKTTTTGVTAIGAVVNNTGTIDVQSGTVALQGGGTEAGTFNAAAGAAVNFAGSGFSANGLSITGAGATSLTNGGGLTIAGPVSADNFAVVNGTLDGSGTLTINSSMSWTGGTMSGAGTTLIASGATLTIDSANTKILDARTLDIAGNAIWQGSGTLYDNHGSTISVRSGSLFEVRSDATMSVNVAPFGTMNVAGTLRKTTTTGVSALSTLINNSGTVDVQSGTLSLQGGGTETGAFTVASGATLTLTNSPSSASSTFTMSSGSFSGAGAVTLGDNATLTMPAAISAQNFALAGGTLTGAGNFTVTGSMIWMGGTMSGSGTTIIPSAATLKLNGGSGRTLNGRTLNNAGTTLWQGGSLSLNNAAVINNLAGATFEIRSSDTLNTSAGTLGTINNAGTLRKILSNGTTGPGSSGAVNIVNGGVVDIESGILSIGALTQTAGGILAIRVGGITTSGGLSQLITTAPDSLSGTLALHLASSFVPALFNSFTLLTYPSRTGSFAAIQGLTLPDGNKLTATYNPTTLTITYIQTDLAIAGGATPDPVLHGATLTYSYTISNSGPSSATGVSVSDTLPAGATLSSATATQGSCTGTAPVLCTIGSINNGASVTLTLSVTAPATQGTIQNSAALVLDQPDPNPSDNTITTYTADVSSSADLAINGISPPVPQNGDIRRLTISGQNFDSRAAVSLNHGTRSGPDPGPVFGTIVSNTPTSITADFDLTSEDILSDWDVIVQNGDGRSATRPVTIAPDFIYPVGDLSGTSGFPIGSFRTNSLETFNFGNDDAVALVKVRPPEPGTIQLKIGPLGAPEWDGTTDPNPSEAMLFARLPKSQLLRMHASWMIPAQFVQFAEEPGKVRTAEVSAQDVQIKIGDGRMINWEEKAMARHQVVDTIKGLLVSKEFCTGIGKLLAGVNDRTVSDAVDQAIDALHPEGSTGQKLMEQIGEKLGGMIPGFNQAKYAAEVGGCLGTILQAIDASYQIKVKHIADLMRSDPKMKSVFEEVAKRQQSEGLPPTLQTYSYKAVLELDEALSKPACRPPGLAALNAAFGAVTAPWDPNDKTTRSLVPCQRTSPTDPTCVQYFTSPTDPIDYTIDFENKAQATAPATNVTITDALPSTLDPTTLEILSTSSPSTFTYSVSGQTATFTFTNINLPPDVNPPEGQGYVRFRVKPVANLATGTTIDNSAAVVFDFNPAILTPTLRYVISDDVDGDGVLDMVEDLAPNGGDGNGDGIPDKLQSNVTSLPLISGGGGYVTVATSGGCTQNLGVKHLIEGGIRQPDTDFDFPAGVLSFSLPCSSANVTIFHHTLTTLASTSMRRYGPTTPGDNSTKTWYTQPGASIGSAAVGAATVPTTTFALTEGAAGDDTASDGLIVVTAGAGTPASALSFGSAGFAASAASAGTATITVNRAYNSTGAVTVQYATADGTAVAGSDYTAASGTLSWADGDLAPKTFTVSFFKSTSTDDKMVKLALSNPTGGASLALPNQAVLSLIAQPEGDVNGDGSVTAADVFAMISYLFASGTAPVGPADVNADGAVNVADVFYLINYLFAGGPAPK